MDQIVSLVTEYAKNRYEDDSIDRFNFQYTSYLFAFFGLVIGYNTYFGTAITCWTPAEFRRGWSEYTRDYCLIENTYYIPIDEAEMPESNIRKDKELSYYQWVQFVLIFFAFLHYLPYLLWHSVNWWSGLQIRGIVTTAANLDKFNEKKRKAGISKIANHLNHHFVFKKSKNVFTLLPKLISRNWVASTYLFTKLLFVIVNFAQLIAIHYFLGFSWNDFFGLRIGFASDWISTGIFPRQTMCDFDIRKKGSIQKYSVQCVLPLNMLNEKIFLALFYYLLALNLATIFNLIKVFNLLQQKNRLEFATRMLRVGDFKPIARKNHDDSPPSSEKRPLILPIDEEEKGGSLAPISNNDFNQFLTLNPDLRTVFHLISSNAGNKVTSDVLTALFDQLINKKTE